MNPRILHRPDPDHPGWWSWTVAPDDRFNASIGAVRVRPEGPGQARCRIVPGRGQSNLADAVHGGAILTLIDVALFAGGQFAGVTVAGAVTLDLQAQFLSAGALGVPLDCTVELLRETGRLAFFRGLVTQEEARIVAAWSGTLRKASARP